MSSETDHPRQRTVAELLAQHGGGGDTATGRRRRRREADDASDDPGAGPGQDSGAGAAPSGWSPQPPEPAPPDRSPGPATGTGWEPPRPPAAPPQPLPPTAAGQPSGALFGGTPARGVPANGVVPHGAVPNGSSGVRAPDPPATGQWGAPARREPDRGWPSADPARDATPGYWPPEPEPDPRRGQRPDQGPSSVWDAQPRQDPRPSGAWDARAWEPAPVDPQATGQRGPAAYGAPRPDPGPREQPMPRAFPPGPEQLRGSPPPAQSPHAGSAPLAASASPFAPPRSPVDEPTTQSATAQSTTALPSRQGVEDPGLTGPIDQQRLEAARLSEATGRVQRAPGERRGAPADPDGGPATAIGSPPAGAEDWHRKRTGPGAPPAPAPDDDGGPATQASQLDLDDLDDYDEIEEFSRQPAGLGPKPADGQASRGHELDGDGSAEAAGGQSWAPVLAQWVIGAIGGAALWVGFRFLWSNLLVVAIAAAVLVTVGLVIVVRAVLRNRDLRTTLAAVLVGILLTVSPAALVLLGR